MLQDGKVLSGIEKELEDAMHDFNEDQYVNSQE